jgi:hypothetical protein
MMRFPHAVLLPLTSILVLVGGGFGCSAGSNVDDRGVEFVVAEVDSIEVPSRIAPSDSLSVHLYGTVGPNGCYSLDRIKEERSAGTVTLTPVVRHRTGGFCTMAIVPLDATHDVPPPFEEGTLDLVVPQPDQPDVTATVTVD